MEAESVLVPLNIVIYTSIVVGVIQARRRKLKPGGKETTFTQLEAAMVKRFPDMPVGFTMREGLQRARSVEPDLGWDQIEKSLDGYEAFRYGGGPLPPVEQPELAKLVRRLRSGW